MTKLVAVLKKKKKLDVETFQSQWLQSDVSILKALPSLKTYSQSHTLKAGYSKITPVADGIAEFGFENTEDCRDCINSTEFERIKQDLAKFTEAEKNIYLMVEERVIKDNKVSPDGVKSIELVKKKEGMRVQDFQRYWTETHGPLGASISQVNRYVQNHVTPDSYELGEPPLLDGLAITWFDSTQDMRGAALTEEYRLTRDDEKNFLTIPLDFIITKEHLFF